MKKNTLIKICYISSIILLILGLIMSATDLENTGKSLEDYFLDIVGGNNNE